VLKLLLVQCSSPAQPIGHLRLVDDPETASDLVDLTGTGHSISSLVTATLLSLASALDKVK